MGEADSIFFMERKIEACERQVDELAELNAELLAALKALTTDVAQPGLPSYDKAVDIIAKVEGNV
jgi:hypothetical protein